MKPLEVIKTQAAKTFFIAELLPKQIRSPRLLFGFFLNHGTRLRKSPPYFCCVSRYVWQCLSLRVRLRSFSLNISGIQELSIFKNITSAWCLFFFFFFLGGGLNVRYIACVLKCSLPVGVWPTTDWGDFLHTQQYVPTSPPASCPCLLPILTLVLVPSKLIASPHLHIHDHQNVSSSLPLSHVLVLVPSKLITPKSTFKCLWIRKCPHPSRLSSARTSSLQTSHG